MTEKISRRTALSSGAAFTGGLIASSCAKTPPENNSTPAASPAKAELSDVWGEDFLTQWSPGPDSQREVIAGSTPVRLSCTSYRLRYERMSDIDAHIKELKALGYTAAESGDEWYQATDSQITELNDALRENDFLYYTIHVFCNDIHPDPVKKEENYRRRRSFPSIKQSGNMPVNIAMQRMDVRMPRVHRTSSGFSLCLIKIRETRCDMPSIYCQAIHN